MKDNLETITSTLLLVLNKLKGAMRIMKPLEETTFLQPYQSYLQEILLPSKMMGYLQNLLDKVFWVG